MTEGVCPGETPAAGEAAVHAFASESMAPGFRQRKHGTRQARTSPARKGGDGITNGAYFTFRCHCRRPAAPCWEVKTQISGFVTARLVMRETPKRAL